MLAREHEHARGRLPREAADRFHRGVAGLQIERDGLEQREQRRAPAPAAPPMPRRRSSSGCARPCARAAARSLRCSARRRGRWAGLRPSGASTRTLSPTGGNVSLPTRSKRRSASVDGVASSTSNCEPAMVSTSPALMMRAPPTVTPLMLTRLSGDGVEQPASGHGAQRGQRRRPRAAARRCDRSAGRP